MKAYKHKVRRQHIDTGIPEISKAEPNRPRVPNVINIVKGNTEIMTLQVLFKAGHAFNFTQRKR